MATKRQSGFTLIEALIYFALFGMLFTGAVVSAYSVLGTSGRNQTKAMLQSDGTYILAKINWALSQAQIITVPAGGDLQLATASGTLEFKPDASNNLLLVRDGGPSQELNNSNEKITNLFFVESPASGDKPQGVNYGFTINSLAPNGAPLSADFSSTIYLRK